jgi:very-short-patch-repair endonuclease
VRHAMLELIVELDGKGHQQGREQGRKGKRQLRSELLLAMITSVGSSV